MTTNQIVNRVAVQGVISLRADNIYRVCRLHDKGYTMSINRDLLSYTYTADGKEYQLTGLQSLQMMAYLVSLPIHCTTNQIACGTANYLSTL